MRDYLESHVAGGFDSLSNMHGFCGVYTGNSQSEDGLLTNDFIYPALVNGRPTGWRQVSNIYGLNGSDSTIYVDRDGNPRQASAEVWNINEHGAPLHEVPIRMLTTDLETELPIGNHVLFLVSDPDSLLEIPGISDWLAGAPTDQFCFNLDRTDPVPCYTVWSTGFYRLP